MIKNKADLHIDNDITIYTNNNREITAQTLNLQQENLIDSIATLKDANTFQEIQSYNNNKAFNSDNQIISKKYVDDSIDSIDITTTLTGQITGTGSGTVDTTIATNTVSNSNLSQMTANTVKVNNTNSTANATDLTISVNQVLGRRSTNIEAIDTIETELATGSFNVSPYTNLAIDTNWTNDLYSGVAVSGSLGSRLAGVFSNGCYGVVEYTQGGWIRIYSDPYIKVGSADTLISQLTTSANWVKVSETVYLSNASITSGNKGQRYYVNGNSYESLTLNSWIRIGYTETIDVNDINYIPKPQVEVNKADNSTFILPAKYGFLRIIVESETTTAGNISIGTADGLSDVVGSTALHTVIGNKKVLNYNYTDPTSVNTTLYINIDSAATVKLHISLIKLFE